MIVPYAHLDELQKLPAEAANEMMALSQRMETVLRELYSPDGINLGMNIGKAAGAGIAGHIHMHVLPRWVADANFVSVVGETRVLPETLEVTWARMRAAMEVVAACVPDPIVIPSGVLGREATPELAGQMHRSFASLRMTTGRLASEFLHFFFVDHRDAQFLRLVQLRSGIGSGHDVVCFLADRAGDLAAGDLRSSSWLRRGCISASVPVRTKVLPASLVPRSFFLPLNASPASPQTLDQFPVRGDR